ncbi:sigma 54-interacting transcriptional regulator [uncultured Propionivibrio sp.]|uniref:sigma 54-interacting transcriptional regulator n=1 Tax=uncultured Propionivibrio sp. TaxID=426737 RepID=UPI0029BFB37D|nr:sigma 54-interacting transcriptional regulator [uncultured Propionivibrio sp.]
MTPILLLSPMQSISDLAPGVAETLGIDITIETSDDASARKIIQSHPDIEVVVTRGGLAEQARQIPGISVVEISMSLNDLLAQLSQLTSAGFKRIGVVSRANLFSGASGDFPILDVHVSIRPQEDEAGTERMVRQMVEEGFEAIIGCRVAYETARALGVRAIFLENGRTSIRSALEEALRILEAKKREKLQAAQLTAIIDNIDEAVIAVTPAREVSFFNRHARRLFAPKPGMAPDFTRLLSVLDTGEKEQVTSVNGNSVIARSIPLEFDHSIQGTVLTLHEVARIQASESKIRSSFHQKGLVARYHFKDLIGESDVMQQLIERAMTYAGHDSNLLVYGETGTGKEVFAQSIHNHSRRKHGPFVSVNIASIAPSLLESELFGYVDGAFTGARKGGKPGLFELAHRGTLFLDEIGELAPEMQSRLLRVLQEREIMRIGDDKIIPIDVRIIAATNRDLFQQTQSGSFRQDLYYRIHVVGLRIPPLRARVDDIPQIFEHYLQRFSAQTGRTPRLNASARQLLKSRPWPGNIRQLRNLAEVMSYRETERVDAEHLAAALGEQEHTVADTGFIAIPDRGTLKEMESEILRHLLARNPADTVCQRLGISRVTLWRKMQALAMSV